MNNKNEKLSALYNKLRGKLVANNISDGFSLDESEEIVQDVSVKAINSADLDHPLIDHWFFKTNRTTRIDRRRVKKSQPHEDLDNLFIRDQNKIITDSLPFPQIDPVMHVENHQLGIKIHHVLQQLTEEQQQAINLVFVHGFSTAEAAKTMGKNPGAVRALIMRSRKFLRPLLQDEFK